MEPAADKRLRFERRAGVWCPRWGLILLAVLALVGLAAVGLLAGYLAAQCRSSTRVDGINDTILPPPKPVASMLPTNVVPEHYRLVLQPYMDKFTFRGQVSVTVLVRDLPASNITMHAAHLDVDFAQVEGAEGSSSPSVVSIKRDEERDFLILPLSTFLSPGERYVITVNFTGVLNDQLVGFYRSSYRDRKGETRWLATTQFQPTDARRAFPCFDEPGLKSTFDITIIRWVNMSAVSNMPIVRTEPRGDGWEADIFNTTVRMSTYLLAFVVSEFTHIGNDKFKVWARTEGIGSANYALDIGPRILNFYEQFFQIPFPLPKMDLVAVPDFNAGAMENWGLIIFRETALLFDEQEGSSGNKQRVATVVAHELAHQWFGNLVTPRWWDDLWLNEGFASYVEYLGVNAVAPEWNMDDQFVLDEVQDVMSLDCLLSSHPVSQPVGHPDEINEIFDRISYGKGATLIRMMKYFLGNETFKRGLTNYLKAKAYDNADQNDLWKFLTEAQTNKEIDVKKVMESWTLQTGFPVVTIKRDYPTGTAEITQARFLVDRNASSKPSTEVWEVPVTYTTKRDARWEPTTRMWLRTRTAELSGLPAEGDWLVANLREAGYYRVNYDRQNWDLLLEQLATDHTRIHVINRAQILDDVFNLAKAGLVPYELALNATGYLDKEQEHLPWAAVFHNLHYLDIMLDRTESYGFWKSYILKKIEPLYQTLGWEKTNNENIQISFLRNLVLGWACSFDHPDCVRNATQRFQTWLERNVSVAADVRPIVYCTGIKGGSDADWEEVWRRSQASGTSASERDKLMSALACSRQPWLLTRYLGYSQDTSSGIRLQDGGAVFRAVAYSRWGRELALDFLRSRWETIYSNYGKSAFSLGNMVKSVGAALNTRFHLNQMKEFKKGYKLGAATRAFDQMIEGIEDNVQWIENNYETVAFWLKAHQT